MGLQINYFLFAFFMLFSNIAAACTTILIGKKASANGSVMLAHNEDMGKETAGVLKYVKSQSFSAGATIAVPYQRIAQVGTTYAYWGSGNAKNVMGLGTSEELDYAYNHILVGMNEHGVAMVCNWMHSKEANLEKQGIRRYAIRQMILERAKTSREAVNIIAEFIEKYGQADWGGLTYAVADSEEGWVVETTSKHWVARRVKDEEVWTVANRFTITNDYDLASEDLIDFALQKGWLTTKREKIDFRATYGKMPENAQQYDIGREALVSSELSAHIGAIDERMLMKLLQHRYQNKPDYQPVMAECWRSYCEEKNINRPLSSCLTQSSTIAVLHPKYKKLGGKMWYALASPHAGIFFPLYGKYGAIHTSFKEADGQNRQSNWWQFRQLQEKIDADYQRLYKNFALQQGVLQQLIFFENMYFETRHIKKEADWASHQKALSEKALKLLSAKK